MCAHDDAHTCKHPSFQSKVLFALQCKNLLKTPNWWYLKSLQCSNNHDMLWRGKNALEKCLQNYKLLRTLQLISEQAELGKLWMLPKLQIKVYYRIMEGSNSKKSMHEQLFVNSLTAIPMQNIDFSERKKDTIKKLKYFSLNFIFITAFAIVLLCS